MANIINNISVAASAPSVIADAAAAGAGNVIGTGIGVAGGLVGQAAGLQNLAEGCAEMAADLVSNAAADIVAHAGETLASNLIAVVKPPNFGDVTKRAAQAAMKVINEEMKDEMESILSSSEKKAEKDTNKSFEEQVGGVANSITKETGKVSSKIQELGGEAQKILEGAKKYAGMGEEWMQRTVNKYTESINSSVDDFINGESSKLLDAKQKAVDSMGDSLGQSIGKTTVKLMGKKNKDAADQVREKKSNVVTKAKAKVGKALLNLLAKIGG